MNIDVQPSFAFWGWGGGGIKHSFMFLHSLCKTLGRNKNTAKDFSK